MTALLGVRLLRQFEQPRQRRGAVVGRPPCLDGGVEFVERADEIVDVIRRQRFGTLATAAVSGRRDPRGDLACGEPLRRELRAVLGELSRQTIRTSVC